MIKIKFSARLTIVVITTVLLSASVASAVYSTYIVATTSDTTTVSATDIKPSKVASGVQNKFRNRDSKNFDKNLKNMENLINEYDIPDSYVSQIADLAEKGYEVKDIFIAYEFLNQKYGSMTDLEALLVKNKTGQKWKDIFKEYNATNKDFTPSDFPTGVLESLLKTGMTPDDIMIADITSKKDMTEFNNLIDRKKKGEKWKDIKTDLKLVNSDEKIKRMPIAQDKIDEAVKNNKVTRKEAIDTLSLANKTGKPASEVCGEIKSGKSKDEILSEGLDLKYK
jgi:hypothetical protein